MYPYGKWMNEPYCPPQKITIRLLASITFDIVNQSEYAISDYETITNYLHLDENPILFGPVVTKK